MSTNAIALGELRKYVNGVCGADNATLQIGRHERITSGRIISFVLKARLSTAANPKDASIVTQLVRSFDQETGAPVNLMSRRLPDELIKVKPWNWDGYVRISPSGETWEWELARVIRDRVWTGALNYLLLGNSLA